MRRVLVVENQRLLGAGIEQLLRRETELEVIGVMPGDGETLLQAICRTRPDVVVLDEATTDLQRLSALLQDHPGLMVVLLSADDHLVRTYEARQVVVTQAVELTTLIKG
jgi:DNA-binding NarL/FixJ family response regulator